MTRYATCNMRAMSELMRKKSNRLILIGARFHPFKLISSFRNRIKENSQVLRLLGLKKNNYYTRGKVRNINRKKN